MDGFLYKEIATYLKVEKKRPGIPACILEGLAGHIELRPYQKEALEYTITCLDKNMQGNAQTHLLYHMATGSGKTVMMAALILYYYKQGYRNFLFFVNQTNILEKTRDNFLNTLSKKYLFKDFIRIDGKYVPVEEVSDFTEDPDGIHLLFTSTQKLHQDLFMPRENGLSVDSFSRQKVVLISDESHHINASTKKPKKDERDEAETWEGSVERAFRANTKNVLLEFTATCDLKNPNVERKYKDKIVYNYPLARFRESGYTKDFMNVQTDYEPWERTLMALIMSEYRRALFARLHQDIKPVVLLKLQTIAKNKAFYEKFQEKLAQLGKEELLNLSPQNNFWFDQARAYFLRQDPSLRTLTRMLQREFSKEHAMLLDNRNISADKQIAVNSLEDPENPYRIIFTVDMLNEGWDVLNLFDIVRLYETRQSGGKGSSPYTIKEAQLIGRGARYCPFVTDEEDERFRRKFDQDIRNPYRLLETLLFHSRTNSRYIEELRTALKEIGLLAQGDMEERTYTLKTEFKETKAFRQGVIFTNRKVKADKSEIHGMDDKIRHMEVTYRVPEGQGGIYFLLDESKKVFEEKPTERTKIILHRMDLREIPYAVLSHAAESEPEFYFDSLQSRYPNLRSLREFLTSDSYLGRIHIIIENHSDVVTRDQYLLAARKALSEVSHFLRNMQDHYIGTKEFHETPLRKILRDKTIRFEKKRGDDGHGYAQSEYGSHYFVDLKQADWYVFNDNYGTNEEKALVKYFQREVRNLYEMYDEVYLIRNEQFKGLSIYNFDDGRKFEPDFVLLLKKEHTDTYEVRQVFIEPKGPQLVNADQWKENFLLRLKKEAVPTTKYIMKGTYSVEGLPFYNEEEKRREFDKAFQENIEDQYGE